MAAKDKVSLPEDGSVQASLAKVHKENSDIEWVVLGYKTESQLYVVAEGQGGLENIKQHLPEKMERYALLHYKHQIDKSNTSKFVYVDWTPDGVSPMRKALLSTHKGQIAKLVEPYHVDLVATTASEVDENEILKKIGVASGTASHVVANKGADDKKVEQKSPVKYVSNEKKPAVASQASKIEFVDDAAFQQALSKVRKDDGGDTWMIARYAKRSTLEYLKSGQGSPDEFAKAFESDAINFGLLRVTEKVDMSTTTKFVYIRSVPEKTPPMRKAEISVFSGAIDELFRPYHVTFDSTSGDVSEQDIVDKVASASGTKSHVIGKK